MILHNPGLLMVLWKRQEGGVPVGLTLGRTRIQQLVDSARRINLITGYTPICGHRPIRRIAPGPLKGERTGALPVEDDPVDLPCPIAAGAAPRLIADPIDMRCKLNPPSASITPMNKSGIPSTCGRSRSRSDISFTRKGRVPNLKPPPGPTTGTASTRSRSTRT